MTQGEPQEAGVHEGQILAGKYRVERVLGVGGMGVVVAATHLQLDTKVALKFLLPTMLGNPEVVGRFAREARAAARIQSEHVARVLDVGALENGAPYIVMEFLEGGDLGALVQRQGPLPDVRRLPGRRERLPPPERQHDDLHERGMLRSRRLCAVLRERLHGWGDLPRQRARHMCSGRQWLSRFDSGCGVLGSDPELLGGIVHSGV